MTEKDVKNRDNLNKVRLFYSEALRQYNLEMDAYGILKDKSNSLLASVGTMLTLLTIAVIQVVTTKDFPSFIILIFLLVIPYGLLIVSLLRSIESYSVSELATINPQKLVERHFEKDETGILKQLISNISDDLEKNKKISKERTELINSSLKYFKLGIISLVVVVGTYLVIYYLFLH